MPDVEIISWLGLEGVVQPFEEDEECDVEEVRRLLDEPDEEPSC